MMFFKNVEAFQPKRRRVLKKRLGCFEIPLWQPHSLTKKNKVRFSSSWLSAYTKDTDLQSISMTTRVKTVVIGCQKSVWQPMTMKIRVCCQNNSLNLRELTYRWQPWQRFSHFKNLKNRQKKLAKTLDKGVQISYICAMDITITNNKLT